jgi:hypothetical protein
MTPLPLVDLTKHFQMHLFVCDQAPVFNSYAAGFE